MTFSLKDNHYYRNLIFDRYHKPQNNHLLKHKNSVSFHYASASCADHFDIELTCNDKIVIAARFGGSGCVIAVAAIDLFCELITNKHITTVTKINNNYLAMLQQQDYDEVLLADLRAFINVLKQPHRLRCALIIHEAVDNLLLKIKENNNDEQKSN